MVIKLIDPQGNIYEFDVEEQNTTFALAILLLCLNHQQREALLWHIVEGCYHNESLTALASSLGISRSTLSRRLRSARAIFASAVQTTACFEKENNE